MMRHFTESARRPCPTAQMQPDPHLRGRRRSIQRWPEAMRRSHRGVGRRVAASARTAEPAQNADPGSETAAAMPTPPPRRTRPPASLQRLQSRPPAAGRAIGAGTFEPGPLRREPFRARDRRGMTCRAEPDGSRFFLRESQAFAERLLNPFDEILPCLDRSRPIDEGPDHIGFGDLPATGPPRQTRRPLSIEFDGDRRHGNTLILPCSCEPVNQAPPGRVALTFRALLCHGRFSARWGASCPRQGSSTPTQRVRPTPRTFFRPDVSGRQALTEGRFP